MPCSHGPATRGPAASSAGLFTALHDANVLPACAALAPCLLRSRIFYSSLAFREGALPAALRALICRHQSSGHVVGTWRRDLILSTKTSCSSGPVPSLFPVTVGGVTGHWRAGLSPGTAGRTRAASRSVCSWGPRR